MYFRSKIRSQAGNSPKEFKANGMKTKTFWSERIVSDITTNQGTIYRFGAFRCNIQMWSDTGLLNLLPFGELVK